MASSVAESLPDLNQLFRDISLKFYPAESEDIVQYLKRIYGEQFKSLGNQDLLSCLDRLYEFGYVSSSNLTLLGEFVASKSINQNVINKRIENFKVSLPSEIKTDIELQGRSTEIREIMKSLNSKQNAVVNLYGATGIGKTTLAKKIYAKWMGKKHVFDLRENKDMGEVYVNIMGTLKLSVPERVLPMVYVVGRIRKYIENESDGQPVLFLLDNVEQLTEGKGNEGKNLRIQLIQFLNELSGYECKKGSLNMLLTSRFAIKVKETVTDYELQPLENVFSEKILLPGKTSSVNTWQRERLLGICKGVPLLLKGTAAILRQRRKSPNDLIRVTETSSQKETQTPSNSNLTENKEEKLLDFKGEGVDESQMSVIREMFNTLPSDSLRMSAVSLSLFHAPFSATTAAKVLGMRIPEAVVQLEGLTTSEIIQHVLDGEDKKMMYDIHPLLKKYAESIANEAKFCESYTKAERRFYEHFLSEMKRIAGFIESDYVKAFFEFERDRQNYEFTIDSTLLPEYFSVPGGYQEKALIVSLFNAMLTGEKQTKLFRSWVEVCRDDGNLGKPFASPCSNH